MVENIEIRMADGYYVPSTILWLLAEDLTLRQVALLLLNEDPEHWRRAEYPDSDRDIPMGYEAGRQVIASALHAKKVQGSKVWKTKTIYENDGFSSHEEDIVGDICADKTTINMDSLRAWLASKNISVEQFVGLSGTSDDFLERDDPKYAPKLAATIAAWRHVKKNPINGMSVKQQLTNWLTDNGARYWPDGMDAKVTDTFIKEAARIANWDADGGRPSISENKIEENAAESPRAPFTVTQTVVPKTKPSYDTDLDDEIPF